MALSINLERILKGSGLPGRAGEAIVLLLTVLVVSTFGLVPGQSPRVLGAEVLGFGLLPWLILIGIHVDAVRRHAGPSRGFLVRRIVLAQGAVLPLLIAGVSLLLVTGPRPLLAGPRHRALPGGGGVGCVGTARRDPSVTTSPVLHGFHLGVTGLAVLLPPSCRPGATRTQAATGTLLLSYDHRPPLTQLALCYVTELTLGWIVAEPSRTGRGVSQ